MGFTQFWRDSTELHRNLLDFTRFYWVLPSFTGFYQVLPSFTEFYCVLPGFVGDRVVIDYLCFCFDWLPFYGDATRVITEFSTDVVCYWVEIWLAWNDFLLWLSFLYRSATVSAAFGQLKRSPAVFIWFVENVEWHETICPFAADHSVLFQPNFIWISLRFHRVLTSFTRFYLVLPSFTRCYRVLASCYQVWLGFTGFYWVLPSLT